MTIDRDDPEGRSRSPQGESVETACPSAADVAACRAVRDTSGNALLREGLSPQTVVEILDDAERELRRFRQSVKDPHEFLVKRILVKRDAYRKRRGFEPGPDAEEQAPHLLDVARTRAALDTLNRDARVALEILYARKGTYEDVAEALGVSVAYVPRLVARALDKLGEWRPQREARE